MKNVLQISKEFLFLWCKTKQTAMTTTNTAAQVREESSKISREVNGRAAVIVCTGISARKAYYGVQFWTPEMIAAGSSVNTDRTVSVFVENL